MKVNLLNALSMTAILGALVTGCGEREQKTTSNPATAQLRSWEIPESTSVPLEELLELNPPKHFPDDLKFECWEAGFSDRWAGVHHRWGEGYFSGLDGLEKNRAIPAFSSNLSFRPDLFDSLPAPNKPFEWACPDRKSLIRP